MSCSCNFPSEGKPNRPLQMCYVTPSFEKVGKNDQPKCMYGDVYLNPIRDMNNNMRLLCKRYIPATGPNGNPLPPHPYDSDYKRIECPTHLIGSVPRSHWENIVD
jgi:hypothetical protein